MQAIELLRGLSGTVTLIVSQYLGSPDISGVSHEQDSGDLIHATLRPTSTNTASSGSSDEDDIEALTRAVQPGEDTEILIDKGQTGLGLSIVGGSDTLLVSFYKPYIILTICVC